MKNEDLHNDKRCPPEVVGASTSQANTDEPMLNDEPCGYPSMILRENQFQPFSFTDDSIRCLQVDGNPEIIRTASTDTTGIDVFSYPHAARRADGNDRGFRQTYGAMVPNYNCFQARTIAEQQINFAQVSTPQVIRKSWAEMSYADIITMAIMSAPDRHMTINEIYAWITTNVPAFKQRGNNPAARGWKNTIRHTLSIRKRFIRIPTEMKRRSLWTVNLKTQSSIYIIDEPNPNHVTEESRSGSSIFATSSIEPRLDHARFGLKYSESEFNNAGSGPNNVEPRSGSVETRQNESNYRPKGIESRSNSSGFESKRFESGFNNIGPELINNGSRSSNVEPRLNDVKFQANQVETRPSCIEFRRSDAQSRSTNDEPGSSSFEPRSNIVEPRSSSVESRSSSVESKSSDFETKSIDMEFPPKQIDSRPNSVESRLSNGEVPVQLPMSSNDDDSSHNYYPFIRTQGSSCPYCQCTCIWRYGS